MKKSVLFSAVAMLALGSTALMSCGSGKTSDSGAADAPTEVAEEPQAGVIVLDNDTLLRPDKAVSEVAVLDFNATWCIPCKKLAPAFDKAAETYAGKAKFYSVDFEKNPETAKAFGVTEVPCVVILSPSGISYTYPSLNDFISAEQLQDTTLTADKMNEIIYGSLSTMVETAIK